MARLARFANTAALSVSLGGGDETSDVPIPIRPPPSPHGAQRASAGSARRWQRCGPASASPIKRQRGGRDVQARGLFCWAAMKIAPLYFPARSRNLMGLGRYIRCAARDEGAPAGVVLVLLPFFFAQRLWRRVCRPFLYSPRARHEEHVLICIRVPWPCRARPG